jgi:hypothetical protein
MAIKRKGQEAEGQGLPSTLVNLTERAATYYTTHKFFEERYNGTKAEIEAFLDAPDCPVTVSVGPGGGVKVPGVASLSFSQPERVNNEAAVAAIVAALKDGSLQPDALVEIVSTVNKEGLLKALPEQAKTLVATSEKVVVTLRAKNEFKADVVARLEATVSATEKPAPAAEVTLVQPEKFQPTPLLAACEAMAAGAQREKAKRTRKVEQASA